MFFLKYITLLAAFLFIVETLSNRGIYIDEKDWWIIMLNVCTVAVIMMYS